MAIESNTDTVTAKDEFEFLLKKIFKVPFNKEQHEQLLIYYALALKKMTNSDFERKIGLIVKKNYDVEALEFYLRIKDRSNDLTKRLNVFLYLIETDKSFYEEFVNPKSNFLRGFVILAYFTLRSIYLFFKGKFIHGKLELV